MSIYRTSDCLVYSYEKVFIKIMIKKETGTFSVLCPGNEIAQYTEAMTEIERKYLLFNI